MAFLNNSHHPGTHLLSWAPCRPASTICHEIKRNGGYVMLVKVANKEIQTVISALIKQAKKLPAELYKSLTRDRGSQPCPGKEITMIMRQ